MNEIGQGFTYDLTKTFDTDELLYHVCPALKENEQAALLKSGEVCPKCGKLVQTHD